jgi:hypothetical protein
MTHLGSSYRRGEERERGRERERESERENEFITQKKRQAIIERN